MQLVCLWFSQSGRASLDDTGNDAADGISLRFHLLDEAYHGFRLLRVRTAYGIRFGKRQVVEVVVVVKGNGTHLRRIGLDADA